MISPPTRRLRFVLNADPEYQKRRGRGRPQTRKPLLIAIDGVYRLRKAASQAGRPRKGEVRAATREKVIQALAHDWSESPTSIREYLKDSDAPRYYYRRARLYATYLRREGYGWQDIADAVAEHFPGNKRRAKPSAAANYFEFNLAPLVPLVHQRSKTPKKRSPRTDRTR